MQDVARQREAESERIPDDLDFRAVPQLSFEAQEKFERVRPTTLGQAGRIPGVGPADVGLLALHLAKRARSSD